MRNGTEINEVGTKRWFKHGKLHRTDGPAIEYATGSKHWYLKGQRHRTDGPAIERFTGNTEWWQNDKRHRLDGPAIELTDGTKRWFIYGVEYTEDEFVLRSFLTQGNELCVMV